MKEHNQQEKQIEYLQNIASSWNGEDDRFMCGGEVYYEGDAHEALELLEKLKGKEVNNEN